MYWYEFRVRVKLVSLLGWSVLGTAAGTVGCRTSTAAQRLLADHLGWSCSLDGQSTSVERGRWRMCSVWARAGPCVSSCFLPEANRLWNVRIVVACSYIHVYMCRIGFAFC